MSLTEQQMEREILSSKIVLTLTVGEINQILSIVGKYPFAEVQAVIRRIQDLGQPQIDAIIVKLKESDSSSDAIPSTEV